MLRKISFLLVAFILPLCIVEYYARLRFADYADAEYFIHQLAFERLLNSLVIPAAEQAQNPLFGYALSANATETISTADYSYTIHTNSLGFRTRELAPRQTTQQRLLLFGDSMLFGVGLAEEQTLAAHLERLGTTPEQELQVYNYSMLSFSTTQALIAARAYAAAAQPTHMLLGIFVANDLLPNAISHADSLNHLAYDTARINLLHRELAQHLAPLMPSIALRAWAYHTWVPRLRFQFSAEERFIQPTYALIDEFAALAQSLGARASVVIIYPRYSVSGGLMGLWSASEKTGALLAEHCRTKHIPVLDLIDHIQGAEDAEHYYYAQDGHFNGAGNERVARAIYQELIAR